MNIELAHYDDAITYVINEYLENAKDIALVEYGRGHKELAFNLIDAGYSVKVVDDLTQNVFLPDDTRYQGLEEYMIEHNILSAQPVPDIKVDLVFASIPHIIPNLPPGKFYPKVKDSFEKMKKMVRPGGFLITLDYNTVNIKKAVSETFDEAHVSPLIDTNNGFYIAAIHCE